MLNYLIFTDESVSVDSSKKKFAMSSTIVVKSANTRKAEYICSCRMCSYVEWQTVLFRFPQFLPRNANQSDWPTTIATFSNFDFYVCFSAQLNPLVCSSLSFIHAVCINQIKHSRSCWSYSSRVQKYAFLYSVLGHWLKFYLWLLWIHTLHDPRGCEGSVWPIKFFGYIPNLRNFKFWWSLYPKSCP